jgi:DnaK suppressor protein
MSNIAIMNESVLEEFRDVIERRLHELDEDVQRGAAGTDVVTLDQQAIGRLSRQDAPLGQAMSQAQQGMRAQEIQRLRAALVRIDEGSFGSCKDCGEKIAVGRLRLDPSAVLCIDCANG